MLLGGPQRLSDVQVVALQALRLGLSAGYRRAVCAETDLYVDFCLLHGLTPFPVEAAAIGLYAVARVCLDGIASTSLTGMGSKISRRAKELGHTFLGSERDVLAWKDLRNGLRDLYPHERTTATPLRAADVLPMARLIDRSTPRGKQLALALQLYSQGALRGGELVSRGLKLRDLELVQHDLAVLHLRRTKTTAHPGGKVFHIPFAARAWEEVSIPGLAREYLECAPMRGAPPDSLLFPTLQPCRAGSAGSRAWSGESWKKSLRALAAKADCVHALRLALHSARGGTCTDWLANGLDVAAACRLGHWANGKRRGPVLYDRRDLHALALRAAAALDAAARRG